jgi:hypothetical protein
VPSRHPFGKKPADRSPLELLVLDVVYLVGIAALFSVVILIARAVEKL